MMLMNWRRILPKLLLSSIFPIMAFAMPAPHPSSPVKIRVRVAEAVPSASVRGFDLRLFSGMTGAFEKRTPAAAVDRMSTWEFHCHDGRIRASADGSARKLDLQEPVLVETPAGFLSFRNRPYRERILIRSVGSFCEVINEVDIEKYLDGLVNSEFSAKWNDEAVAAQVVAARTYALHQIRLARAKPTSHFDVDASIKDQVYDGSVREDFRSSRSVERTRGIVLSVTGTAQPVPLKAFYHSTCGGKTELPQEVWGNPYPGFKRTVTCPFCGVSPRFKWDMSLRQDEIANAFLKGTRQDGPPKKWPANWEKILKLGRLLTIKISKRNPEGRVTQLLTTWSLGSQIRELPVSGVLFRDWVGTTRFRSTAFEVALDRSTIKPAWRFDGHGNGHGVGMCQWGAKVMGEKGHKMAAILQFYYPDAVLRKAW